MCQEYAGRTRNLEYKTIRYPGHGRIFAAMREIGLFETAERRSGDTKVVPRAVLIDLLTEHLPRGRDDVTLVSVAVTAPGYSAERRIEDVHDCVPDYRAVRPGRAWVCRVPRGSCDAERCSRRRTGGRAG